MMTIDGSASPQSDTGQFLVIEYSPTHQPVGVLLAHDGRLHRQLRDDWPESHPDYDYLMALGPGLDLWAAEMGPEPLIRFLADTLSNALTITHGGAVACSYPHATLFELYERYVAPASRGQRSAAGGGPVSAGS